LGSGKTDFRCGGVGSEKHQLEERLRNGSFDRLRQRAWQLALSDDSVEADLARQLRAIAEDEGSCRDRLSQVTEILEQDNEEKRTQERASALLQNFQHLCDVAPYEQRRELASALVQALGGARASKAGLVWLRSTSSASSSAGYVQKLTP